MREEYFERRCPNGRSEVGTVAIEHDDVLPAGRSEVSKSTSVRFA